jgi:hypothetical protein
MCKACRAISQNTCEEYVVWGDYIAILRRTLDNVIDGNYIASAGGNLTLACVDCLVDGETMINGFRRIILTQWWATLYIVAQLYAQETTK